jgi:signal transduction histidine kinase
MSPKSKNTDTRKKAAPKSAGGAKSGTTTFRPRARLLRILGEELISDDVVAVTELVKNAHDADATRVHIRFEGVTGQDGRIIVEDDGDGMDLDTLLHRWMEPASSLKGRKPRTRKGRRMLGEKGVGRFAVDKLAARLELVTRMRGQKEELHAEFDWDQYADDTRMLSEISSPWKLRKPELIKKHGTVLAMSKLRGNWNERAFRRMCTRLSRLIPPGQRAETFQIEIASDEFPDYSGVLDTGYLDHAPYRAEACFDGDRSILIKVNGHKSSTHPWNGREELRCGPVRIELNAFDLDTESLASVGSRMEVRGWLRHWSGVSIYRDGFRVWPYGEPHDDWLRLDQRRVNNPVVRLSNNQMVGFVHLGADSNPELRDQTNREGLINNEPFEDLRRLVYFVLQILEAHRQSIRHPKERRSPGKVKLDGQHPVARDIEELAGQASGRMATRIKALAKRAHDHAEREEAGRRQVVEGLVELAAIGQAASEVHSSVSPTIESIEAQLKTARTHANGNRELRETLRSLDRDMATLRTRLSIVEPMSDVVTKRRHNMDLRRELEAYVELMQPILDSRKVKMDLTVPPRSLIRSGMRPQTFHRLLQVLTLNTLDWIGREARPRIRIELIGHTKECEILFSDNGPGVPAEVAERIFEPLMSMKEGGKGMGLTIAEGIAEQHGGRVELVTDRRRKGTTFRITLPRKAVHKTPTR